MILQQVCTDILSRSSTGQGIWIVARSVPAPEYTALLRSSSRSLRNHVGKEEDAALPPSQIAGFVEAGNCHRHHVGYYSPDLTVEKPDSDDNVMDISARGVYRLTMASAAG